MKVTYNVNAAIILLILLILLWWLCRKETRPPQGPRDEPKTVPYLTADELATYQWREGKIT